MSVNKKPIKKKQKAKKVGKSRYSLIIILVMLVLLAIPVYILGDILYNAYIRQGVPIVGDRYEGDLEPAITKDQLNSIKASIEEFQEAEEVSVNVQTSTLKIFVDVKSDVLSENYEGIVTRAYESVLQTLPKETYLTGVGAKKMYDLEISVFNQINRVEGEAFYFYHLTKTSTMDEPIIQDVANAKNQEVADRLRYEQALRDLGESGETPQEELPIEEITP